MNEQNGNSEMTSAPLQPMSFVDILDGVFSLYRSHFTLFLRITGVYFVLTYGMDLISVFFVVNTAPSTAGIISILIMFVSYGVIFWVVAGLVYASAEVYLNRAVTSGAALQQAQRRFWSYIGTVILWLLVVCALFVTVIGIPFSIYFGVRWGLYGLPIMFEETTVRNALRRSTELVKGSWWRAFGIMLAIFLIAIMIQFILIASILVLAQLIGTEDLTFLERLQRLYVPTSIASEWLPYTIQRLFTIAIAALTMPISAIGAALLYFDLRIRKEGFDIEMMAAADATKEAILP